jgi:hypothetical protein
MPDSSAPSPLRSCALMLTRGPARLGAVRGLIRAAAGCKRHDHDRYPLARRYVTEAGIPDQHRTERAQAGERSGNERFRGVANERDHGVTA